MPYRLCIMESVGVSGSQASSGQHNCPTGCTTWAGNRLDWQPNKLGLRVSTDPSNRLDRTLMAQSSTDSQDRIPSRQAKLGGRGFKMS